MANESRLFAEGNGLRLGLPVCDKGTGHLIRTPDSLDLIDGVRLKPWTLWPDDRGFFFELHRLGQDLVEDFPVDSQISAALSYLETIKAFHYHLHQRDCWTPSLGMFQVVLVDFRVDSPTFGRRNTMYVGQLKPWQILIPRGVGHGYKIIGGESAMLVYLTDKQYNPKDEGRIPFNDPSINYDWETQHK